MKTRLLILCAVLALATWATAQTTTNKERNLNDKVDITSGPNVTTTNNSATIRWQTNNVAATSVKYGTSASNMSQEQKHSGGSRDHNVQLTGLQAGTTYHYAILDDDGAVRQQGTFTTKGSSTAANATDNDRDRDRDRDEAASQSGSMTTTGASDNIRITMGPEIRNFNGNSATLYWQTDKTAANEVHYGTNQGDLNQKAYEPGGSREHSVQLSNLQPGQTYYFEILRNNGSVREPGSFTLPGNYTANSATAYPAIPVTMSNGTMAPQYSGQYPNQYPNQYPSGNANATGAVQITSGPTVLSVSGDTAIVAWTTSQPSSSIVRYGQSWLALNQQAEAQWGTDHRVTISGLRPNTKYYFRAESAAAQGTGQQARSQFGTFQTGAPGQAAQAPR